MQDYEILDFLGKGGFASVYRARCLRSGFEVALKMVSLKLDIVDGVDKILQ